MLRETIIEKEPFAHFYIECAECGEELFTLDDLEDGEHLRNEALLRYRVEEHAKNERHFNVAGTIKPHGTLKTIDATITINDDV